MKPLDLTAELKILVRHIEHAPPGIFDSRSWGTRPDLTELSDATFATDERKAEPVFSFAAFLYLTESGNCAF